jgi:hypothetical protein
VTPQITAFSFSVDVPDLTQTNTNVSISAGGTNVTFPQNFHSLPNTQITIVNATAGDDVILTNQTVSGFTIQVKNGGSGVARVINWLSQGY